MINISKDLKRLYDVEMNQVGVNRTRYYSDYSLLSSLVMGQRPGFFNRYC